MVYYHHFPYLNFKVGESHHIQTDACCCGYPKQAWLSTKKPSNNYNSQEDPWYLGLPDWNQGAPKFDGLCVYPRYDHFPHFNRYILCLSSPGRSQLRHPFSSSRSRACQGLQHCDRPNNLGPMGHKLQDPISHQQHRNIRTSIVVMIVYFEFVTYVWYYTFVLCLILFGGILDLIHFHTRIYPASAIPGAQTTSNCRHGTDL